MKLGSLVLASLLATSFATANSSINALIKVGPNDSFRGYKPGNSEIKHRLKAAGYYATAQEVADIMDGKKEGWQVVDLRTKDEWAAATIAFKNEAGKDKPIRRIGRQTPEIMLETLQESMEVNDASGKKHKVITKNLDGVVIVCRTGTRAAFDWASYSFAGFGENVKIFGITDWAKDCRGLVSKADDVQGCNVHKKGITLKKAADGLYYSDQCKDIKW